MCDPLAHQGWVAEEYYNPEKIRKKIFTTKYTKNTEEDIYHEIHEKHENKIRIIKTFDILNKTLVYPQRTQRSAEEEKKAGNLRRSAKSADKSPASSAGGAEVRRKNPHE
jgi:hypothetical protein